MCASADPSPWKCVSQHGQNRPRGEAGKQGTAWVALRCRGSTLPGSQFRVESCCGREAFGSVLPLVESVEMKSFAAPWERVGFRGLLVVRATQDFAVEGKLQVRF